MVTTLFEIVGHWDHRRMARSPLLEMARTISAIYSGEMVLPTPELDGVDIQATANLLAMGIDQHAMRIASVLPDITAPPTDPGKPKSEDRARLRRRAAYGWWYENDYELLMKQRARWLVGYSCSPVQVSWGRDRRGNSGVRWRQRDPLTAFPSDEYGSLDMEPRDCVFAYAHNVGWLKRNYPDLVPVLTRVTVDRGYQGPVTPSDDDRIEMLEFYDDTETVLAMVGRGRYDGPIDMEAEYGIGGARIVNLGGPAGSSQAQRFAIELARVPNRTGICPIVIPGRITLGPPKGQFDDAVPLFRLQSVLQSLEVQAVANSIWPDTWVVARSATEAPQVIKPANGRKGVIGLITGGELKDVQINPGYQTTPTINKLERDMRISTGIPADFGGEAATNVRTAARGQALLAESVDYYTQESQQVLAKSMQHELERATATEMAYAPDRKRSFYVQWKGATGRLDYTPRDIFTEDRTLVVSYAKAGADQNQLAINAGMRVNNETMSRKTFMRIDPMIQDPELEEAQIEGEQLQRAGMAALQSATQSGQMPITVWARVAELREQGKTLREAVQLANQEEQQRQAQPPPPQSPEAQPGLAQPGVPTTPQAPQGLQNYSQVLRMLRSASLGG